MILVRDIQRAVAEHYGLPLAVIAAPDHHYGMRRWEYAHPRQDAMLLARKITGGNKSHLGRLFGGRDHATILSGIRAARKRCLTKRTSLQAFCEIRAKVLANKCETYTLSMPL